MLKHKDKRRWRRRLRGGKKAVATALITFMPTISFGNGGQAFDVMDYSAGQGEKAYPILNDLSNFRMSHSLKTDSLSSSPLVLYRQERENGYLSGALRLKNFGIPYERQRSSFNDSATSYLSGGYGVSSKFPDLPGSDRVFTSESRLKKRVSRLVFNYLARKGKPEEPNPVMDPFERSMDGRFGDIGYSMQYGVTINDPLHRGGVGHSPDWCDNVGEDNRSIASPHPAEGVDDVIVEDVVKDRFGFDRITNSFPLSNGTLMKLGLSGKGIKISHYAPGWQSTLRIRESSYSLSVRYEFGHSYRMPRFDPRQYPEHADLVCRKWQSRAPAYKP